MTNRAQFHEYCDSLQPNPTYLALCNEISKYSGFVLHFSLACDMVAERQNNLLFMAKKETIKTDFKKCFLKNKFS